MLSPTTIASTEKNYKNVVRGFERKDELGVLIAGKDETVYTIGRNKAPRKNAFTEIHTVLGLFKAKAETSNIFTRRKELSKLDYIFDGNIGPGKSTKWASNEETDLLLRLLRSNILIAKDENVRIIHHSSQGSLIKTLQYGMGRYELIRRNILHAHILYKSFAANCETGFQPKNQKYSAMLHDSDRMIWPNQYIPISLEKIYSSRH